MIDTARIHHHGIAVADIEQAVADYGAALGLRFAPIRDFDPLAFWTPEAGTHEIRVRATYSVEGPPHIELVQGEGAFYDPVTPEGARHIAVWVDDLPAEAQRLIAAGWSVAASNAAPEEGFGLIAYMRSPDRALLIELVAIALKPVIDGWLDDAAG